MSQTVGIRELQQHASKVVADAVAHGPVTITQRGRAVAMVVPLAGSGLEELREQGLVTPARRRMTDLPPALAREESLTAILEQLRENERD
ncbi:MAG: type II toxin-antitoxin system prevent-host-death family antitoxin [Candidatus Nanopelagicales bacterium]|nr:type II toxin-antitoxin system prevent-host-death family antitoxin [Candidatus Nanopelagicales bacterium]MCF8557383.1 type II toxin-antitoxin system prevent-host-death family antitoxin [Candidatus Nanopelagicales bacterium]